MHQDLLQLQTFQTFSITKNTSPKIMTLWNHLNWCLKAHWPKITHFSGILLSHIFPLDRNDTSNLEPKVNPFKTILIWEKMLQAGRPSTTCDVAQSRPFKKKRKKKRMNKRKRKLIVMSCTWKIRLSLNENQESRKNVEKMMKKLHKHKSFFSCKESLFSLVNYVSYEKWSFFIILSLI